MTVWPAATLSSGLTLALKPVAVDLDHIGAGLQRRKRVGALAIGDRRSLAFRLLVRQDYLGTGDCRLIRVFHDARNLTGIRGGLRECRQATAES